MRLYLVRHGEAKSEIQDPSRSLTDRGRCEVEKVANMAKGLGVRPSKVLHSGKIRAEQTAEILSDILGLSEGPKAVKGLNPNDNIHQWVNEIFIETEELMLVGHLPFMDKLSSLLLCGNEDAGAVLFCSGAMVCLEQREKNNWTVRWILTPEVAP